MGRERKWVATQQVHCDSTTWHTTWHEVKVTDRGELVLDGHPGESIEGHISLLTLAGIGGPSEAGAKFWDKEWDNRRCFMVAWAYRERYLSLLNGSLRFEAEKAQAKCHQRGMARPENPYALSFIERQQKHAREGLGEAAIELSRIRSDAPRYFAKTEIVSRTKAGGATAAYTYDRQLQHLRLPLGWHLRVHKPGYSVIHGTLVLDVLTYKPRYGKNRPFTVLALRPIGRSKLESEAWVAEIRWTKGGPPKLWWLRQDDCPHGVSDYVSTCERCRFDRQHHTQDLPRNPDILKSEHRREGHDKPAAGCPYCEGREN